MLGWNVKVKAARDLRVPAFVWWVQASALVCTHSCIVRASCAGSASMHCFQR